MHQTRLPSISSLLQYGTWPITLTPVTKPIIPRASYKTCISQNRCICRQYTTIHWQTQPRHSNNPQNHQKICILNWFQNQLQQTGSHETQTHFWLWLQIDSDYSVPFKRAPHHITYLGIKFKNHHIDTYKLNISQTILDIQQYLA